VKAGKDRIAFDAFAIGNAGKALRYMLSAFPSFLLFEYLSQYCYQDGYLAFESGPVSVSEGLDLASVAAVHRSE